MTEFEKFVKQYEDSLGKGVIVRDYCYKGGSMLVSKTDSYTGYDYTDYQDYQSSIRVVGTLDEIKKLEKDWLKERPHLQSDEVYEYDIVKEGDFWYDWHKDPIKRNKEVSENIKRYKEKYSEIGAFIV